MELNNREVAVLVWVTIALIAVVIVAAQNADIRKSLLAVLRTFFTRPIPFVILLTLGWIALSVLFLRTIGTWHISNLKTTVIWGLTFAFVTVLDINRITTERTYFAKTLQHIFGATAVVEFIATFYSLPLLAELVLIPLLTLVGLMHAFAEARSQYANTRHALELILIFFGLGYLSFGLFQIMRDLDSFVTAATLAEFAVPIFLSLLFLPFIYLLSTYTTYERIFATLKYWINKPELHAYAQRSAILGFKFDLDLLRRWQHELLRTRPSDRRAIKQSITNLKERKKHENAPPPVDSKVGWSPYAAKEFLTSEGFETDAYDPVGFDDWWSSTGLLHLREDGGLDFLEYSVDGDRNAVKRLKLELWVFKAICTPASEKRFEEIATTLLTAALGQPPSHNFYGRLIRRQTIDMTEMNRRIQLSRKDSAGSAPQGYVRTLIIAYRPDYRFPYDLTAQE